MFSRGGPRKIMLQDNIKSDLKCATSETRARVIRLGHVCKNNCMVCNKLH